MTMTNAERRRRRLGALIRLDRKEADQFEQEGLGELADVRREIADRNQQKLNWLNENWPLPYQKEQK